MRLRSRSSRTGSRACGLRVSITANAASSTAAAASEARNLGVAPVGDAVGGGGGADQGVDPAAIPAVPVSAPGRSNRPRRRGSRPVPAVRPARPRRRSAR